MPLHVLHLPLDEEQGGTLVHVRVDRHLAPLGGQVLPSLLEAGREIGQEGFQVTGLMLLLLLLLHRQRVEESGVLVMGVGGPVDQILLGLTRAQHGLLRLPCTASASMPIFATNLLQSTVPKKDTLGKATQT